MTIKHICDGKTVESSAEVKTIQRKSYYENFHSDDSGWYHWTEVKYIVKKCSNCGNEHEIDQKDVL